MIGGFSKWRSEDTPDPMHSSLALLGSGNFMNMFSNEVQAVCPYLGITASSFEKLKNIKFQIYVPSVTSKDNLVRSTPIFDNIVFRSIERVFEINSRTEFEKFQNSRT